MRSQMRIAPMIASTCAIVLVILAVLPGARQAIAESVKEAKQSCTGNPDIGWNTQIKSCTTLIQSGGESGQNSRGLAGLAPS